MNISWVGLILLYTYIIFLKNLNLHSYGLSECSSIVVYLIGRLSTPWTEEQVHNYVNIINCKLDNLNFLSQINISVQLCHIS